MRNIKDSIEKIGCKRYNERVGIFTEKIYGKDLIMAENEDIRDFDRELEEVEFRIKEKDFDQALDLLGNMVAKYEGNTLFENDDVSEYYCFEEPMQEILYHHLNHPKKELRRAEMDFMALYYFYGSVLIELGSALEARASLEKARRWNPVSATVAFEYGETFKMTGDFEEFAKVTREIHPYIYKKRDLARFYRNLGFYYIEKEEYATATCCFLYSGGYEPNPMIAAELKYIEEKTGERYKPTVEEVRECFLANDIPPLASEEVLKIAFSYGNHFHEEGNMEATQYFWGIFSEFIPNEMVEKVLEEIEKKKE